MAGTGTISTGLFAGTGTGTRYPVPATLVSAAAACAYGRGSSSTRIYHPTAAAYGEPPNRIWLAYDTSTPRSQTQEPALKPAVFPSSRGLFVGGGAWAMAGSIADGGWRFILAEAEAASRHFPRGF